jgi:hypothetical protein
MIFTVNVIQYWLGICELLKSKIILSMKITTDIRYDFLIHTKLIKNVEVVHKKKNKHSGELLAVRYKPFEMSILAEQSKNDLQHIIGCDIAEQISIQFLDGTVKTYQGEIA